MDRKKLQQMLERSNVPESGYNLTGEGGAEGCYNLVQEGDKWLVFQTAVGSESNQRCNLVSFDSEADACEFLFKMLVGPRREEILKDWNKEKRAKKMRRSLLLVLLAALLVLLGFLYLSPVSKAEGASGKIIVNVQDKDRNGLVVSGIRFELYQIASSTEVDPINWKVKDEYASVNILNVKTSKDLDKACESISNLIRRNSYKPIASAATNSSGTVTFDNVPLGIFYGQVVNPRDGLTVQPFIATIPSMEENTYIYTVTASLKYEFIPTPTPAPTPRRNPGGGGASSNTPTPSPEPSESPEPIKYRVKVNYYVDGVYESSVQYVFEPNTPFNIVSPPKPGYVVDIEVVKGVADRDYEFDVHYVSRYVRLTINYIYEDGTIAHDQYTNLLKPGDPYSVVSPRISGYTASIKIVEGVMPGTDREYTVIYVPGENVKLSTLEDYEVPLGLGNINMNIGLSIE